MSPARTGIRRALTLVVTVVLAVAMTACDGSGSSKANAGTSTTTKKHKPHGSTTTSSTTASTTSTTGTADNPGTPGTTAPTLAPPTAPPTAAGCGEQAARITATIYGGDLQGVPLDSYSIAGCRLAPSAPIWGAVALAPKPGQTAPPLTVVVELLGSIWSVHSFASGATGCDAPAPVPAELQLGC